MDNNYENIELQQKDYEFLAKVKLSIYRGLVGEIVPGLRAIFLGWKSGNENVKLFFYHDGAITDATKCHYSLIMVVAGGDDWYYEGKSIGWEYDLIRLDYPQPLPEKGYNAVAYLRKEPFVNPE